MRSLNIAFIGGGMMAQCAHIPFYVRDPRCNVVAICESRPSLVEALKARFDPVPIVASHREILERSDVDAVVVSIARHAIAPMVLAALEAGKHVIAEKPMAYDLTQGRRLVEAAESRGLGYHVGYMKRHDGGVQAARQLIGELRETGRCGRLLAARFHNFSAKHTVPPPPHARPRESNPTRFPTWPILPDGLPENLRGTYDWFMNAVSHDINLVRFLLGNDIVAGGMTRPGEDAVAGIGRVGEVAVTLNAARSSLPIWAEGAEFVFERGRVTLDIPSPMAVDAVSALRLEGSNESTPAIAPGWAFERQAAAFVTALVEGKPSLSTGADTLGDLALIEAFWRSLNS